MEIAKMMDKYGPDIIKNLQIATGQLYEKLMWYIRIDGIVQLTSWSMGILVFIMGFIITHHVFKKNKLYAHRLLSDGSWMFIYLIVGICILVFCLISGTVLIPNIAKIVAPEYYIINQIITQK